MAKNVCCYLWLDFKHSFIIFKIFTLWMLEELLHFSFVLTVYIHLSFRYVIIAMEAMDQLLVACHAQSLNLFVESFLKMVQKLLECHEPEMQLLAAQSVRTCFLFDL